MTAAEFFAKFTAKQPQTTISTSRQVGTLRGLLSEPNQHLQPNKEGFLIHDKGLGRFISIKNISNGDMTYVGVSKELSADIKVEELLDLPIYSGFSEEHNREWKTIGKSSVGNQTVSLADLLAKIAAPVPASKEGVTA